MPNRLYSFHNVSSNKAVAGQVKPADSYIKRLLGLLFSAPLKSGEGLWLSPCNAIHTIGMRFAIDVVFLDRNGTVLRVYSSLPPGRLSAFIPAAHHCLELSSGQLELSATKEGDKLTWSLNEQAAELLVE